MFVASLAAGCGEKGGSIQPEAKPTASAAAVESPPPSPSDDTPLRREPAPVVPVPVHLSGEKLPLQVFAGKVTGSYGSYTMLRVFPVGDRMVVGPGVRALSEGRITDTPGMAEVQLAGEDLSGFKSEKSLDEVELMNVVGRYPDDLWLDVQAGWGYSVARSNAGTWVERRYTYLRQFGQFGRVPDRPVSASPWSKRRTLAYLGEGRFRLSLNNRKNPDPLPKQAAGKSCPVRVDGKVMMALPSGRVAVLGQDCDAEGALALERWGPATDEEALSKSEILPLPGAPKDKPRGVWVLLHDDVTYAVAHYDSRSYVAEVREGRVTELEAPYAHIADAHVATDGTLFLAGDETVYRYDGVVGGRATFTAATLPKNLKVKAQHGLFAESRQHVFWAVQPEGGSVILSTHAPSDETSPAPSAAPSAAPSVAPTSAPSASGDAPEDPPTPGQPPSATASAQATATASVAAPALLDSFPALTDTCTTPLVVLFPVARSTPKDFDFATTKDDLKDYPGLADIKLVEIEHGGERFLAAVVKDPKSAATLVTYLTAKKKEPAPRAVCFPVPAAAREIK